MKKKPRIAQRPKKSADTADMLSFIVEHMSTKDDLRDLERGIRTDMATKADLAELRREMHGGFASIQGEVREGFDRIDKRLYDIERRLDTLEEQSRSHGGFAKEIDTLRAEIAAIKRHVGLPR